MGAKKNVFIIGATNRPDIKTSRPENSRVNDIRSVGSSDDEYVLLSPHSVHLCQDLLRHLHLFHPWTWQYCPTHQRTTHRAQQTLPCRKHHEHLPLDNKVIKYTSEVP